MRAVLRVKSEARFVSNTHTVEPSKMVTVFDSHLYKTASFPHPK